MKKEEIFKTLADRYPNRTSEEVQAITADVFYSGEPESILAAPGVVDRLFNRLQRTSQDKVEAQRVAAESNDFCPICKMATAAIKLDNDRPAKWCSRHHVVFPAKAKR